MAKYTLLDDDPAPAPKAGKYVLLDDAPAPQNFDQTYGMNIGGALKDIGNLAAGAVRGAGSIGATLMYPVDKITDLVKGDRGPSISGLVTGQQPLSRNEERRQEMTNALETMGADPNSWMFKGGKLGTEVAGTLGVGGALANGARALGAAPQVVNAIRTSGMVTGNVPIGVKAKLADMALRMGASGLVGGASSGLIDPHDAGTGVVLGAALPPVVMAAGRAGAAVKSLAEPLYDGGRKAIVGRALRQAAGNNLDETVRFLQAAKSAVPGVEYTAAEAANNPGIAALQRTATAVDPAVMNEAAARQAANNAALVSALEGAAGTAGDRVALTDLRAGTAEDLYKQAYGKAIDLSRDASTGAFLNKAQQAARQAEITKLMRTPAMQEAAQRAQQMMLNDPNLYGKAGSAEGSVQGMDYMRRALGDMIQSAGPNEQRILIGLRDRLDTTLQSVSPKYLEAKNAFAEMSKPINEMDVMQEIANKSVNKLTGNLQPAAFARALTDQTAATATGLKSATLDKTLSPQNRALLDAIKKDLVAQNFAQTAGRGVGSDTVQKLAFSNMLDQSGIPNFVRNFGPSGVVGNLAQKAGQTVYRDANQKLAEMLGRSLLSPSETARLMIGATPSQKLQLLLSSPAIPAIVPAISASR